MKKILLLLIMGASIQSCTTKPSLTREQKIDTLINHYLDTTLNDPKSYEAIKFGEIDTVFTDYTDDDGYKSLPKSGTDIRLTDVTDNYDLYEKRIDNGYYDKLDKIYEIAADSLSKLHKPSIRHFNINHTYRAKNGFNALTIHTTRFSIDTTLTKILNAYRVKE